MNKTNKNHYAIKLFKEMMMYGIECMQLGAITATLHRPENDLGVFTLSLINRDIQNGVIFNVYRKPVNSTIVKSKVYKGENWYESRTSIPSAELFND